MTYDKTKPWLNPGHENDILKMPAQKTETVTEDPRFAEFKKTVFAAIQSGNKKEIKGRMSEAKKLQDALPKCRKELKELVATLETFL